MSKLEDLLKDLEMVSWEVAEIVTMGDRNRVAKKVQEIKHDLRKALEDAKLISSKSEKMDKSEKVMNLLEGFYDQPLPGGDEVGTFWVVTQPTEESVLQDICFSATVRSMMLQGRGGLKEDEIIGIFKEEQDAKEYAEAAMAGSVGGFKPPSRW